MERLHKYFSHNMAAVEFWLAKCVFPFETQQFPHRLTATPWHLADNAAGEVVGFSGTKDIHRLLPTQVYQTEPSDAALRGTDGKMFHLLLESRDFQSITPQASSALVAAYCANQFQYSAVQMRIFLFTLQDGQHGWEALLNLAVARGLDAILDCGALLAGTGNRCGVVLLLGSWKLLFMGVASTLSCA